MSLHPYLQLQVGAPPGGTPITSVPPEYLQSLTYKTTYGGLGTLDFTAVDPTYTALEELLLLSDTRSEPLYARFGYPNDTGQVNRDWLQLRLMNYVPRMTASGMEISASTLVDINEKVVEVSTKVYSGKISDVAAQVAADMDVDAEIEETNDAENLVNNDGGPRYWLVKNRTLVDFLHYLTERAISKSGSSNYVSYVTGTRTATRKPTLHFHSKEFTTCSQRVAPIKEFTYLAGKQDVVLDFAPSYDSSLLGKIGAGGLVMRFYDPLTKQYVTRVNNISTNQDQVRVGEASNTVAVPVNPANVSDDQVTGGVLPVRAFTPAEGDAIARNVWSVLFAASFTAQLILVGLPENCDIEANDLIRINALVPGYTPSQGYKTHWSSGLYLITEAVHQIDDQYAITCQLQRSANEFGGASVEDHAEIVR